MLGELHCVIARTRLRRSEDGSPELRVPIQSSDPGPSQARARATRRDAGFGHRASTVRRGIAAQTASPSQHRHAAENKQPGKYSCKNKHGFLKMEIHWLIGAPSLCLGWRGWTSELLHSGIILWARDRRVTSCYQESPIMTSSVTRWIQDANLFTSDVCKPQWLYIYRRLVLWAYCMVSRALYMYAAHSKYCVTNTSNFIHWRFN